MNADEGWVGRRVRYCCCGVAVAVAMMASRLVAAPLVAAGSPAYDFISGTGFQVVPYSIEPPEIVVNNSGMAVGTADRYVAGIDQGPRAVRWDGTGMAATELGNLGATSGGETVADGVAVNDAGTAVGFAHRYVSGVYLGDRGVRWDASGTAATELGNLGTDVDGFTNAYAFAVNDAGTAVGYSSKYAAGTLVGDRAVMWGPDGKAIDLNDLGVVANPPDGTWVLTEAGAVSDNGWVAGDGVFTPNGGGQSYKRAWVAHVSLAVPESSTMLMALVAAMGCVAQLAVRRGRRVM
jgi:hypothetical protein